MILVVALLLAASVRVPVDDPRVQVIGHVEKKGHAVALSWSASELRVRFTGSSLALDLEGRPVDSEVDQLAVFVDGVRRDFAVPKGPSELLVASGLHTGVHEASIVKRTEPLVGVVVVRAVILDHFAHLEPVKKRAHRIELIGDSNVAGFGVLGNGPQCPFSGDTEDVTRSFAGVTAARLQSDLVVVAWSGRGVYRDYDGNSDVPSVPALWKAAAPLDRHPDAVVVALGNNDFLDGIPDRGKFFAAYHDLLDGIRKAHPKAWIVLATPMPLTMDPMDPLATVAPEWIRAIFTKRGDGRMSWVQLPPRDDGLGLGCVWHAGPKMHERLADVVTAELKKRL